MKLLLLLVTGTSAATVQYVRNLCAEDDGGLKGNNFPLDKCMPIGRHELCKGTGGFTGTGWPGDATDGDILEEGSGDDFRVIFSVSGSNISVALYEAANCDGAVSTTWAPAAIALGSANGTTAGYYLEECTTAADGSGCVGVTLEDYSASGCASGGTYKEIFVFPNGTTITDAKVCTATNDVSFVCDADGKVDIFSFNVTGSSPCGGTGATGTLAPDENSIADVSAGSCSGNCDSGTMSVAGVCTGATPSHFYSLATGADPCAPAAASSGNLASAITGTLVGAAMILA